MALEIHSNRLTWQQSNDYKRNEYVEEFLDTNFLEWIYSKF